MLVAKVSQFHNFLKVNFQHSSRVVEVEIGDDIWVDKPHTTHMCPIHHHGPTEAREEAGVCNRLGTSFTLCKQ